MHPTLNVSTCSGPASSTLFPTRDPQDEIDDDGDQQQDGQDGGTKAIVEASLTPLPNALGSPMIGDERVDHRGHGDEGEETGADAADAVAKVEKTDG